MIIRFEFIIIIKFFILTIQVDRFIAVDKISTIKKFFFYYLDYNNYALRNIILCVGKKNILRGSLLQISM